MNRLVDEVAKKCELGELFPHILEGHFKAMTLKQRSLGRWELLGWLNDILRLDYAKVEDCADGVAIAQVAHLRLTGLWGSCVEALHGYESVAQAPVTILPCNGYYMYCRFPGLFSACMS